MFLWHITPASTTQGGRKERADPMGVAVAQVEVEGYALWWVADRSSMCRVAGQKRPGEMNQIHPGLASVTPTEHSRMKRQFVLVLSLFLCALAIISRRESTEHCANRHTVSRLDLLHSGRR